jgi:hypothetical protein
MHEHTRLRRAAQRAAAADLDLADAAAIALEAFDLGAALIDLTHRRIVWCSAGFSSHCCVQIGDRTELLAQALPGFDEVLTRLARAPSALLSSNDDSLAPTQYLAWPARAGRWRWKPAARSPAWRRCACAARAAGTRRRANRSRPRGAISKTAKSCSSPRAHWPSAKWPRRWRMS